MDDDDWPRKPALEYKTPVGMLACPHCGTVVEGMIEEPICGFCEQPYWPEWYSDKQIKSN